MNKVKLTRQGVRIYCESDTAAVYASNHFIGVDSNEDTVIRKDDGIYRDRFICQVFEAKSGKLTVPAGDSAAKLLFKIS